ncbi:glycosyltransferase 87 family protein [Streptomyces aurantiacus]|uniref:glycosyltransferase 87 family protein n=1 Tax=Streptomyces aurantiacus TaxID=47760 RepID=UPI003EBC067A
MTRRYVTSWSPSAVTGILLLVLSCTGFAALCAVHGLPMADALVYRAEGAAVVDGRDLYGFTVTRWELPATYPPFAALLFVPTTWLPLAALKGAFLAGNVAFLVLLLHLSCRLAGLPSRAAPLCAAAACALWLEPVFQTVLFGQINLALACLVLWDLTRPPGSVGKGFAVGVAAGIKLTPAFFIAYLLVTGRVREAATAVVAFAGTVLLGALVLPAASVEFWTRRVFETGRVGKAWIVDNQSLQGLAARVLHVPEPGLAWTLPAVVVAAMGLWAARRAGAGARGLLVAAGAALLVSPISWSHHWVWCVPLIVVLVGEGSPRLAVVVAVVFTARTLWLVPHEGSADLHLAWWQQGLAAPYAVLGVGLLASASLLRSPQPRPFPNRGLRPRAPVVAASRLVLKRRTD